MTAERHGVAAKVIATVDDLDRIAADDEADVPALKGWRRELFGDKALALKHGQAGAGDRKGPRGDGGEGLGRVRSDRLVFRSGRSMSALPPRADILRGGQLVSLSATNGHCAAHRNDLSIIAHEATGLPSSVAA